MIHHLLDVAASPRVVIVLLLIAGLYFATPVTERLYRAAEFLTPMPDVSSPLARPPARRPHPGRAARR